MSNQIIRKAPSLGKAANMPDYDTTRRTFSWADAQSWLGGLPDAKLNIAHEAIDRHVAAGHGGQIALRWLGKEGTRRDLTYLDLQLQTNRFANVLRTQGLGRGDRVYALMGRTPDLYIAALGTLKAGCVFCPLFSAFGPEPIHSRMEIGGANALITTARLYKTQGRGAA